MWPFKTHDMFHKELVAPDPSLPAHRPAKLPEEYIIRDIAVAKVGDVWYVAPLFIHIDSRRHLYLHTRLDPTWYSAATWQEWKHTRTSGTANRTCKVERVEHGWQLTLPPTGLDKDYKWQMSEYDSTWLFTEKDSQYQPIVNVVELPSRHWLLS